MIKDLVDGDGAKKQVVEQDSLIQEQGKQLQLKDSMVVTYAKRDTVLQATINEYSNIEALNEKTIQSLNQKASKLKRQRNAFRIFCGILLLAIAVK